MLDKTLSNHFFYHKESELEWKNEDDQGLVQIIKRKLIPIEEELEDLIEGNENLMAGLGELNNQFSNEINKQQTTKEMKIHEKIETSFEITYEYFENEMIKNLNFVREGELIQLKFDSDTFHPSVIWTEIQSHIKGSLGALNSKYGFLSRKQYVSLGKRRGLINKAGRDRIYDYFMAYDRQKRLIGAFDLQDIIFHLYSQLKYEGYRGTIIHSITIDEVQDFSQSTLQLLMMICKQQNGFFFTGDTCQTIARGVGFRFRELQGLFHYRLEQIPIYKDKYLVPEVHQLTINFRSHSNLIKLGNSIVRLLEYYFPSTIDILAEDQGSFSGPLPLIMKYTSDEDLFAFLFGQSSSDSLNNKNLEQFGAHQVVITRNQSTKQNLPDILQHALCLTIYESKGLEFDDVILFNFFSDSPTESWRVLNNTNEIDRIKSNTDNNHSNNQSNSSSSGIVKLQTNDDENNQDNIDDSSIITDEHISHSNFMVFDHNRHSILCSELKQLYVALTRARKNVFIFEKDFKNLSSILRYWKSFSDPLIKMADIQSFIEKGIVKSTSIDEWKKQGLIMLENQYYPQAIQCFTYAKDEILIKKATALLKIKQGNEIQKKIHSSIDRSICDSLYETMIELFNNAGELYLSISLKEDAAHCFTYSKDYKKSAKLFEEIGKYNYAGDSYEKLNDHRNAGENYLKANNILKSIQQFILGNYWIQSIELLINYPDLLNNQYSIIDLLKKACYYYFINPDGKCVQLHSMDKWNEISKCLFFYSPSISNELNDVIQHCFNNLNENLINQLHTIELSILNMNLIAEYLKNNNNFHFYSKLHSYCFINSAKIHKEIQSIKFSLHTFDELNKSKSKKDQENQKKQLQQQYHSKIQKLIESVNLLHDNDKISILSIFGYPSVISNLSLSKYSISILQSFSYHFNVLENSLRLKNSADDGDDLLCNNNVTFFSDKNQFYFERIRVLIDYVYYLGFFNSPVCFECNDQILHYKNEIDSIFHSFSKQLSNSICNQSYQLIECCLNPNDTRLPFLIDFFSKNRKNLSQNTNFMKYYFISSFLYLSNNYNKLSNYEKLYSISFDLLDEIINYMEFLNNNNNNNNLSSSTNQEMIISLLSIFNLSNEIKNSIGFPFSIQIPHNHIFIKFISILIPNLKLSKISNEYLLHKTYLIELNNIISILFYCLLSTSISIMNYISTRLIKMEKTEEISSKNKKILSFITKISKIIPFFNSFHLKKLKLSNLKSIPKLKTQWLLNENSFIRFSNLFVQFKKTIEILFLNYEENYQLTNKINYTKEEKQSMISICLFLWKMISYFPSIESNELFNSSMADEYKKYAINSQIFYKFLNISEQIYQILSLFKKQEILFELLHFSIPNNKIFSDFKLLNISSGIMCKLLDFHFRILEYQNHGFLLQSIQCLNEYLLFVKENDLFSIFNIIGDEFIAKHIIYGLALFSGLENCEIYLSSTFMDWLYAIPCDPVLPNQIGDLMECLLDLIYNCMHFTHLADCITLLVPLLLLSYFCNIPSCDYDGDLLNYLWERKDFFDLEYNAIQFISNSPLFTGEPSNDSPLEFFDQMKDAEILYFELSPFKLTEFQTLNEDAFDKFNLQFHSNLATRITASIKLSKFVKKSKFISSSSKLLSSSSSSSDSLQYHQFILKLLNSSDNNNNAFSLSFVQNFNAFVDDFISVIVHLQSSVSLPDYVLFDLSNPILRSFHLIWDFTQSKQLIASEYQTVLSRYDNEIKELRENLNSLLNLIKKFNVVEKPTEDKQNNAPTTQEWRQKQIKRLLKQRQGLRKQDALQKKAEVLKFYK